jgi:hypothetical protein
MFLPRKVALAAKTRLMRPRLGQHRRGIASMVHRRGDTRIPHRNHGGPIVKISERHSESVELQPNLSRRALGGLVLSLPLIGAGSALAQTDEAATSILRSLAPHDRAPSGGG